MIMALKGTHTYDVNWHVATKNPLKTQLQCS